MKVSLLTLLLCIGISTQVLAISTQEKTSTCSACHGVRGISPNPIWPNLAGQHASYLIKQLMDLQKNQGRNSPLMAPFTANLTSKEIQDMAKFYAKQALPENNTPKKNVKRGEQLYKVGDFSQHITACIACHGPKGIGNAQAGFPALSGQQVPYMVLQLQAFKEDKRTNDLNAIMRDISKHMTQEDMEAVSNYIAGLH